MAEFKVFLVWSGERSKKLAIAFYKWLPKVIQAIKPWMSEKDIPNGARWGSEISENLKASQLGIVFLTPENLKGEWIHFEAGALATNKNTGLVCTYLFKVEYANLAPPLSEFQHAIADKDGTHKLLKTINEVIMKNTEFKERALDETVLDDVFETYWDKLDIEISNIEISEENKALNPKRDPSEVQNEILESVRNIERILGTKLPLLWSDQSGNAILVETPENEMTAYLDKTSSEKGEDHKAKIQKIFAKPLVFDFK